MKKTTKPKRILRLSRESVRTLRGDQLSKAVGGSCDTTSYTTENHTTAQTQGATAQNCGTRM